MSTARYIFGFRDPVTCTTYQCETADIRPGELPDAASAAIYRAALGDSPVPAHIADRDHLVVEVRGRFLRWEVVPRTAWDPAFKADESQPNPTPPTGG